MLMLKFKFKLIIKLCDTIIVLLILKFK